MRGVQLTFFIQDIFTKPLPDVVRIAAVAKKQECDTSYICVFFIFYQLLYLRLYLKWLGFFKEKENKIEVSL